MWHAQRGIFGKDNKEPIELALPELPCTKYYSSQSRH